MVLAILFDTCVIRQYSKTHQIHFEEGLTFDTCVTRQDIKTSKLHTYSVFKSHKITKVYCVRYNIRYRIYATTLGCQISPYIFNFYNQINVPTLV